MKDNPAVGDGDRAARQQINAGLMLTDSIDCSVADATEGRDEVFRMDEGRFVGDSFLLLALLHEITVSRTE